MDIKMCVLFFLLFRRKRKKKILFEYSLGYIRLCVQYKAMLNAVQSVLMYKRRQRKAFAIATYIFSLFLSLLLTDSDFIFVMFLVQFFFLFILLLLVLFSFFLQLFQFVFLPFYFVPFFSTYSFLVLVWWHFFCSPLLNTVFNGANVYNRCAYGPTRYNLTENTTRIYLYILLYFHWMFFLLIFSVFLLLSL